MMQVLNRIIRKIIMVIHFAGSTQHLQESINDFRQIINAIHKEGHVLARDWVEPSYSLLTNGGGKTDSVDWEEIYKQNIDAVSTANIMIADATHDSFGVGFLIAVAIQQKKPILILLKKGAKEGMILRGLHGETIVKTLYTDENISAVVSKFIKTHTIKHKDLRFNFFLDSKLHSYLNWASHQSGKTKAEIVRDLIEREANK